MMAKDLPDALAVQTTVLALCNCACGCKPTHTLTPQKAPGNEGALAAAAAKKPKEPTDYGKEVQRSDAREGPRWELRDRTPVYG